MGLRFLTLWNLGYGANNSAVGTMENTQQGKTGRFFSGLLPPGRDLGESLCRIADRESISWGMVRISGELSTATLGAFDPAQKVFATEHHEGGLTIASLTGTLSVLNAFSYAELSAVVVDKSGRVFGGRVFSETLPENAEYHLLCIEGGPLARIRDPITGRCPLVI